MSSWQLRPHRLWWWAALLLAGGAACAQTLFMDTDPNRDVGLGRQIAVAIEKCIPLSTDAPLKNRVQRVGQAVVSHLPYRKYTYEFRVLKTQEVNAIALPGGIVYVTEGLLAQLPEDTGLAFVLAHEVAHSVKRHWAEQIRKQRGWKALGMALSLGAGVGGSLVGAVAQGLLAAHYSRGAEREADATAMDLLWRSGLDLAGGRRAMEALLALEGSRKPPRYLSSHPPTKDRLAHLEELAGQLGRRDPLEEELASKPEELPSAPVEDVAHLSPTANPWFPLAPGRRWVYSTGAADGPQTTYVVRIAASVPTAGGAAYRAEWVLPDDTVVASLLLTTAGEVWRRPRPTDPTSTWLLDFLTDASDSAPERRGGCDYQLLRTEAIQSPCGSFAEARVVRKHDPELGMTYDLWLVQNVGLVRRVCITTGVTETLTAYDIPATGSTVAAESPPAPPSQP